MHGMRRALTCVNNNTREASCVIVSIWPQPKGAYTRELFVDQHLGIPIDKDTINFYVGQNKLPNGKVGCHS